MRRMISLLLLLSGNCDREVVFPTGNSWGDPPLPAYAGQARLAIPNYGDDTLAFVSVNAPDQPQLLGTANVGYKPLELEGPHRVVSTTDGRFLFFTLSNHVANGGTGPHGLHGMGNVLGTLVKLDLRTNRPVGKVTLDRSPGNIALSPDGKLVFVSHNDTERLNDQIAQNSPAEQGFSKVAIVDAETLELLAMKLVCPAIQGLAVSPDGRQLYVTCTLSDELAVLDVSLPSQPQVVAKIPVGPSPGKPGTPSYAPYALRVHKSGAVWISNNKSADVRVFDPQTRQMDPAKIVPVGSMAMSADFGTDGAGNQNLYVPSQGNDHVTAIDLATLKTRELSVPKEACLSPQALQALPQGGVAAVVCEGDHLLRKGSVVFLDLAAWKVRGFVETGLSSDGLVFLPPL